MPVPLFETRLAQSESDVRAAQRLRHQVFVQELGATAGGISEEIEADRFDPTAQHLLLLDISRHAADQVVGVYRLLDAEGAARAGGFYTDSEFDLTPLHASGKRLLELGRSCILAPYRGSAALLHLWAGIERYVQEASIDLLFGVASFHGTDTLAHQQALSHLQHAHRAPRALCPTARWPQPRLLSADQVDRVAAMRGTPALIKSYLKLGGCVGSGVYIDHGFNTIDVCMVLDVAQVPPSQSQMIARGQMA